MIVLVLLAVCDQELLSRSPIKHGRLLAGGTFNISNYNGALFEDSLEGSGFDFGAYPSMLYFLDDGLALGGEMNLNFNNRGEHEYLGVGVGPVIRYFYSSNYRMYPYIGAGLITSYYSVDDTVDFAQSDLSFCAGNIFMLNPYIGIDVQAKYAIRLKFPENGEKKTGSILNLLLGFAIFF